MKPIIWQPQPTGDSCASTCCAMILGIPAQQIVDEFHARFTAYEMDEQEYLAEHCVVIEPVAKRWAPVESGHVYMLTVPSLNNNGMFHAILLDYRDHTNPIVYDPAPEGRPRYSLNPEKLLDAKLVSWMVEWVVVRAPALEI